MSPSASQRKRKQDPEDRTEQEIDSQDEGSEPSDQDDRGNGEDDEALVALEEAPEEEDGGGDEDEEADDEKEELRSVIAELQQQIKDMKSASPSEPHRRKKPGNVDEEINYIIENLDLTLSGTLVEIHRLEPERHRGQKTRGYLQKMEGEQLRRVSHDYVMNNFGGGTYQLVFKKPEWMPKTRTYSGPRIYRKVSMEIPGNPIIQDDHSANSNQSPDALKQTMSMAADVLQVLKDDKKSIEERMEFLQTKLLSGESGSKDQVGVLAQIIPLFQTMMATPNESLKAQLEKEREDRQRMEAAAEKREERHRQEMRELKEEIKSEGGSKMEPFIEMMKQNTEMVKTMMANQKAEANNTLDKMVTMLTAQLDITKANAANEAKLRDSVHKTTQDMLMKHIDRLIEENRSSKDSLFTELKKIEMLKKFGLMGGDGGGEASFKTILAENFESIPDIIEAVGNMIRGNPPGQQPMPPGGAQRPALPQGRRPRVTTNPQAAAAGKEAMEMTMKISRLKANAETAVNMGMDAATFVDKFVADQFPAIELSRLAVVAPDDMIKMLQEKLQDNSPLLTVAGRDFLKAVHAVIRTRYAAK